MSLTGFIFLVLAIIAWFPVLLMIVAIPTFKLHDVMTKREDDKK